MDLLTPERLVGWCQQTLPEDTRGFEALVSHYKQRVFAITYQMMQNRAEAEDQAQEVFLKVYRRIATLDNAANLDAWITRVAVNTCLDALTHQQRRPQTAPLVPPDHEERDAPQYVDTRSATPEEIALRNEVRQCLQTALAQLDIAARTALVLRDLEDRPYQEIAEVLALGLSAVKMRIHRARLSFQKVLEVVCPGTAQATS